MTKRLTITLIIALISYFNCISQNFDTVEDSLNQIYNEEEQIGEYLYGENHEYSENEILDIFYFRDSIKTVVDSYSSQYDKIEMNYSGYENGSNEIFYFDSLKMLCAYACKWDMEGTSGEQYCLFDDGNLTLIYDEVLGQVGEPIITVLNGMSDFNELKKYHSEVYNRRQTIIDLITQNLEKRSENDQNVNITIEEIQDFGFEFTITTNIYIDLPLFKKLFND